MTENRIQISHASRGNKNLKNRLVLQDGQKTDELNICHISSVSGGLVKLPSRRAAAVSTVDLFPGVLSDPALSRAGEVSEFGCLRA